MIKTRRYFKQVSRPIVDVAIINGRNNEEWLKAAIGSIQIQSYPKIKNLILDNYQKGAITIGAAWNKLVKESKADYILFLGDDDYLSHDYIDSLIGGFQFLQKLNFDPVHITSYCTAVDVNNKIIGLHPVKVTGMFKRKWLLDNPFNELLYSQVDTEIFKRMEKSGAFSYSFPHFYGYYYRQHENQVSKKTKKNEK